MNTIIHRESWEEINTVLLLLSKKSYNGPKQLRFSIKCPTFFTYELFLYIANQNTTTWESSTSMKGARNSNINYLISIINKLINYKRYCAAKTEDSITLTLQVYLLVYLAAFLKLDTCSTSIIAKPNWKHIHWMSSFGCLMCRWFINQKESVPYVHGLCLPLVLMHLRLCFKPFNLLIVMYEGRNLMIWPSHNWTSVPLNTSATLLEP